MKTKLFTELDLMLFADGGGEGGGNAGTGAPEGGSTPAKASKNPLADVQYGTGGQQQSETIVTSDTQADKAAAFDGLIKGEYKTEFDARVQKILSNRFREVNALKEKAAQLDSYAPMMDALASKYGVSSSDPQAILKAIEEDNSFYEDEALERGLTVEQLKHMKRIERENADFRRAMEEQQRMNAQQEVFQRWDSESAECSQIYPNFNFDTEAHPRKSLRQTPQNLHAKTAKKSRGEYLGETAQSHSIKRPSFYSERRTHDY